MDPLQVINEAVTAHNWPLLVVAIITVLVPLVLTALGKDLPVVRNIADAFLSLAVKMFAKKPVAPTAPAEPAKAPEGVNSVVKVQEEKTK